MTGLVSDLVNEAVNVLNEKKESLIKERLVQLLGYELDVEEECKKLFPRIRRVIFDTDNSEHYYWNDGTIGGKEIIAFYPQNKNTDPMVTKFTFWVGFQYK